MKKLYSKPLAEVLPVEGEEDLLLSVSGTEADPNEPTLTDEDRGWDIWGNEE